MLDQALSNPTYKNHQIGDIYKMDNKPDKWQLVYYPIFENGKTGETYKEPRALMQNMEKDGFWCKEVPLRYLERIKK